MDAFQRLHLVLLAKIAANTEARLVTSKQKKKADEKFEEYLASVILIDRMNAEAESKAAAQEENRIITPL